MKIALQFAMPSELHALPGARELAPLETVSGVPIFEIAPDILACAGGVSKVNAAMGATELISLFEPDAVISTGVAGGASAQLNRMEVVVSSQTCYHDAYCGSEQAYGQIMGMPARFDADSELLAKACAIDCGTKITPGLIVTGDWFVDSREKISSILEHFPEAMAVDMESAAIAQVCYRRGVRFISFRIISDIPLKDDKAQQYYDFWEKIAEDSFGVTKAFMESI